MAGRPVLVLALASAALFLFAPTFVLVTLTSFGALGNSLGNALLLADLGAALAALAAAVLAFRGRPLWRPLAMGAAAVGAAVAAGFVLATWPWTTERTAMVRILLFHLWAPALFAVAWAPERQG